ncbi:lipocalin / cytosolic fatty-acid binding protein family domain-containing protein [Phthorimaea operculella]|nr:lipocalin / cytosolic fatty-acid binding protein family domain-containing protein [Phthorimaea operculella]
MLRLFFITFVAAASASVIIDGACPDLKPVENFNLSAYQGVWYEISKIPTEFEKSGACGQAEYKLEGDVVKVKNSHVVDGVQQYIEGTAKLADDANKAAKLEVTFKFGERPYKLEGDVVKVKNSHVVDGVQQYIEGTAKLADDANKAAKLEVTFKFGDMADKIMMEEECHTKNSHEVHGVQQYIEGTAKLADNANKAAKLEVTFKFGDVESKSPLKVLKTDYEHYAIAYNCKEDEKTKKHAITAWILSRSKKLEGDAKTAVDEFLKANAKELDSSKFVQTDFSENACKFTSSSVIATRPQPPAKS